MEANQKATGYIFTEVVSKGSLYTTFAVPVYNRHQETPGIYGKCIHRPPLPTIRECHFGLHSGGICWGLLHYFIEHCAVKKVNCGIDISIYLKIYQNIYIFTYMTLCMTDAIKLDPSQVYIEFPRCIPQLNIARRSVKRALNTTTLDPVWDKFSSWITSHFARVRRALPMQQLSRTPVR